LSDDVPSAIVHAEDPSGNGRLDSWKEIGAYLKRDVTTVRRWEKREGLPVHRHVHDRRDSVYAYRVEIDRWWQERRNHIADKIELEAPINGRGRERIAWSLAALFLIATLASTAAAVAAVYFARASHDAAELRFSIGPPDQASFGTVSLSPDGRQLAFTAATRDGPPRLWVRPLRSLTPQLLPGTEDAAFPFWSPDGSSIGFFAQGRLKRIDVAGGTPQVVCDAPAGRGGTWNRRGVIVFSPSRESGLSRVAASGGSPTPVTTVDPPGERGHLWPEFLPDGIHFLYLADSSRPEYHNLFVGALDTKERTRLFPLASNATYTRGGYLLFARDRQLIAQPFDARRLAPSGGAVTIADQVRQAWDLDHKMDASVSDNGVLIYRSERAAASRIVWRDRADRQSVFVDSAAEYFEPTLSPDETRIAVDVFDPRPSPRFGFNVARVTSDIWILDTASGAASRFTFDPAADFDPVWSPSGDRLAFSSNRRGALDLYVKRASGTGDDELLFGSPEAKHAQAWSPDGRFLVYVTHDPKTREDLWLLPMVGDRIPAPLLRTEFNEEQASISPDGRWFAYTSDESGRDEVYVQAFPSPSGKWQISTGGGGDARWSADGNELFYIAWDRRLMAVPVKRGATFEAGPTRPLFDTGMQPYWGAGRNHYDVSRDGKRFLITNPVDDDRFLPFTVIVNWMAGLK
jgi:eukaryotic-like serine/threonine-protein kinase